MSQESKRCFTLEIRGGEPFDLFVPLSPLLQYDGTRTLWKVVLTRAHLSEMVLFIRGFGCTVNVYTEEKPEPEK